MRRWIPQVTLAVALASGACRDHSGDATPFPDGGELLQLAELDQALTQAHCEYFLHCGVYDDRAVCEGAITFNLAESLAPHVKAGRVRYDAAAASACVAGIRAGGCYFYDPTPPAPAVCLDVFQGMTEDEQPCAIGAQCRSRVCDLGCGPDACCTGSCLSFPTTTLVAEGEACTSDTLDLDCAAGTVCKLTPNAAHRFTCVRRVGVGEDCSELPCQRDLFCMPGATGPSTCVHFPYRGERCSEALAVCASRTDYCDKSTFTCVPLAPVGTPCESDSMCQRSAFCDFEATDTCQPRRGPGSACRSVHDCLAFLDCTGGVCTQLPARPVCPAL